MANMGPKRSINPLGDGVPESITIFLVLPCTRTRQPNSVMPGLGIVPSARSDGVVLSTPFFSLLASSYTIMSNRHRASPRPFNSHLRFSRLTMVISAGP